MATTGTVRRLGTQGPAPRPRLSLTRRRLLAGVASAWGLGMLGLIAANPKLPGPSIGSAAARVVVTHWANGHVMNTALLPRFAKQFNEAVHRTRSGRPISIDLYVVNSGEMLTDLPARAVRGAALNPKLPNPTIITPAANHWLAQINSISGRTVVDPQQAQTLAVTWVGIVTYRQMAECLGWPRKDIGIADVVELASDPRGWAGRPCAKVEWGKAMMSFTDPSSSSTARSMLFALYSIAARKRPESLTLADVANPEVVQYMKKFQHAVAHYVPDTLTLNSKIYGGFGHFFFIAESNLVQLYLGDWPVTVGGDPKPQALSKEMVFIYPKEGSTAHNHAASIVQAQWVDPEQVEAAQQWISFLREDSQQQGFMQKGFRPATGVPYTPPQGSLFVPDLTKPATYLDPDTMDPSIQAAITDAWDEVKKPGIATFVIDASGSMKGTKIQQAQQGVIRSLDAMSTRNRVGLLMFSDNVRARVPIAPLGENRFAIAKALQETQVGGGTALYDAIKVAVEMTDVAPADEDTIRGVVVATDGRANGGSTCLHDLIDLSSTSEKRIRQYCGFETDSNPKDEGGKTVAKKDISGLEMRLGTRTGVYLFFIGIGGDADMDIGRMLAEASGGSTEPAAEAQISAVLEKFGKYF